MSRRPSPPSHQSPENAAPRASGAGHHQLAQCVTRSSFSRSCLSLAHSDGTCEDGHLGRPAEQRPLQINRRPPGLGNGREWITRTFFRSDPLLLVGDNLQQQFLVLGSRHVLLPVQLVCFIVERFTCLGMKLLSRVFPSRSAGSGVHQDHVRCFFSGSCRSPDDEEPRDPREERPIHDRRERTPRARNRLSTTTFQSVGGPIL